MYVAFPGHCLRMAHILVSPAAADSCLLLTCCKAPMQRVRVHKKHAGRQAAVNFKRFEPAASRL